MRSYLALLLPVVLFGCAHSGSSPMTLVLRAPEAVSSEFEEELASEARAGFRAEIAPLPRPVDEASGLGRVEALLNQAERDYIRGEYASCANALSNPSLLRELLATGRRGVASRLLYWRVACRTGQLRPSEARADAARMVAAELSPPTGISGASQDAEDVLDDAFRQGQDAPRGELLLTSPMRGTHVGVDGRMRVCQAPCNLQLLPGSHVVVFDADGFSRVVEELELGLEGHEIRVELDAAEPAEASAQWAERYTGVSGIGGEASLRLLSRALDTQDLVLVQVAPGQRDTTITASLVLAGERSAEQSDTVGSADGAQAASALVRQLLEDEDVISTPLYRRGWFWGVLEGSVVAGGVAAYVLTREGEPVYDIRVP